MSKDGNRQTELPKLFTIEQVATFTQFSTRQIRRWIKSGAIKATQIGRHWRIVENDLALFLATLKHQ